MNRELVDDVADLVVVGGGPKALYALADLDDELARRHSAPGSRPLRVTVLEAATPGAGAVWDPNQPAHLLMNVDSRIVDASCAAIPLTFSQWQEGDARPFPPRADVGRYLAWSFERICESPRLEVTHRRVRAVTIRPEVDGWVCQAVDVTGSRAASERARRVLLATGHAGGVGIDHADVVDSSRGPRPGEPVVVRGASLTAFDVVMDLTSGRGGQWVVDSAVVSGLRYLPSGGEPSSITLMSRSGEPMLPKPVSIPAAVVDAVTAVTSTWTEGCTPDDAWWEAMADAAMAAAAASGASVTREVLWARLDTSVTGAPDARWAGDVDRALGEVDGDPAWWWGRAWSAGYADVVRSMERAPRDVELWSRWRARAATLERWAFGPPLVTHLRLLALRDAGYLRVARGEDVQEHSVVIDAFTQGPGISDTARPWDGVMWEPGRDRAPWDQLLTDGLVTVRPGERGVLTTPDAACVGADGEPSEGLAALGRPTEDPVIGHDSLQRRLHGDSRRWAHRLVTDWRSSQGVNSAHETEVGTHG
ncbi:FAD/NAD(P)-binding protein [Demequina oxidasica]|uniref:FAD/NAD(P)-binding protein n=1 Tax=Demequina oxidasica TaxID=676199 RepID=UPI0007810AE4|nr:FAD/NAD(P)-binding protein [Demequina oxidasica]